MCCLQLSCFVLEEPLNLRVSPATNNILELGLPQIDLFFEAALAGSMGRQRNTEGLFVLTL